MAKPDKVKLTPQASVTVGHGVATDSSSEFWHLVTGNKFIVYSNVPYALAQNILSHPDPDTAIKTQLAGYPKRHST